ncbi:MAG: HlyD family efflux transporter periplasmic adaptor subunit [Pirellulaceae bacterium]|nr:HlyD family efflux transporter periplasmic adaptor subunit [Pirellulaceae bacterium]
MLHILIRSLVPVAVIAGGVGVMLALGTRQQETMPPRDARLVPQVETSAVQSHQGDLEIEVDGVVTPAREIQVAAEVGGAISFKDPNCRAGSFVEQGTLLIEIDSRDYQLQEQQALKQLEQSQTELEEADVEIANIEALRKLAERDRQLQQNELDRLTRLTTSISRSDLDRAERAVVTAENAMQILENQLSSARVRRSRLTIAIELAESQLQKARLDLSRSEVRAPVDGVIVRDQVEQGDFVQRGSGLFTIEDTASIEVRCNLLMEDLFWLWSQQSSSAGSGLSEQRAYQVPRTPATVYYQFARRDDLRYEWSGELDRFDGIGLDERTRTVPCRIRVDRPRDVKLVGADRAANPTLSGPPALVRGMYVTVVLRVPQTDALVKVPDEAIQPGKRVWRVNDGRLEQLGPLPLIRGIAETDAQGRVQRYWLAPASESRLQPGDRLVITPVQGARDGMQVTLADAA